MLRAKKVNKPIFSLTLDSVVSTFIGLIQQHMLDNYHNLFSKLLEPTGDMSLVSYSENSSILGVPSDSDIIKIVF